MQYSIFTSWSILACWIRIRINWNKCPACCMLYPYVHKTDYFQQYDWSRLLPIVCSMLQRLISDNGWLSWHYPEFMCENGETKLAYNIFGWDVCCALATQNAGLTVTYFKLDSVLIIVMKPADLFLSPECTLPSPGLIWVGVCDAVIALRTFCYPVIAYTVTLWAVWKENICEGDLHSCLTHLSETELTAHIHV